MKRTRVEQSEFFREREETVRIWIHPPTKMATVEVRSNIGSVRYAMASAEAGVFCLPGTVPGFADDVSGGFYSLLEWNSVPGSVRCAILDAIERNQQC